MDAGQDLIESFWMNTCNNDSANMIYKREPWSSKRVVTDAHTAAKPAIIVCLLSSNPAKLLEGVVVVVVVVVGPVAQVGPRA